MPTRLQVRCPADFVPFKKEALLQGIHERIEGEVRLNPGQIALKTRTVAYTYADMNGGANSIAAEILSAVGKDLAQAAILQPNNPEMVISILAALKAHKAYVPLDTNFPKDRLRIMLEDAEPVVLLTDDQHLSLAEELARKDVRIINVSRLQQNADAPDPRVPCDPMDRAYILYTSGSTGRPKGIAFLHRNLLHTTMCLINNLFFSRSDRVTWLHSSSFGSSVVDIYCCLMTGGTLYPWDLKTQGFTGLADWLVRDKVTTLQMIPSAFRQFARTVPEEFVFGNIRMVMTDGEPLSVREVDAFRRHFPEGSHLVNQVGTAESYNYRLYIIDHDIPIETANVSGGYAVSDDRKVVILDEEHHKLPLGTVGEIGVQSEYMSAGYWHNTALTESKFIRIDDGAPVYLTGDQGRLEPDGCLIHLGRKDFQVKIRGHRVELAEVEHVLGAFPGIADAAAWIVKNRLDEDQLVGYVVLKNGPHNFDQQAIKEYLELRLPDYMIPRHYLVLDSLPTLPTGKTDRRSLPNPFDRATPGTATPGLPVAPGGLQVARFFKELLRAEDVSLSTNFLELGGDSLLCAVLLQRVYQQFGVEISPEDFMELPTPDYLAGLIATALESRGERHPADRRVETPDIAPRPGIITAKQASLVQKNLIIISAGRMGREVFTWATQAIAAGAPYRVKGFLDNRTNALASFNYGVGIVGHVDTYEIQEDDVFIGGIGDFNDKIAYYAPIIKRGGRFINLIHPLANTGTNPRLGTGIILAPFTVLTADVTVGDHVSIGTFSNIAHDAVIGSWCQISSHCGVNGRVVLGEGVFLGSHACVIPGVTVGDGTFVGAGSVVTRNVPPGVKVFGNPAAVIGKMPALNMQT